MPKNPVFDLARGKASPELIERLFNSPGAYWAGDEFWTINPTRGDSTVGSFSINCRTGMWSDFAGGGGDLINLIHESGRAASKVKAAELIVLALGGTLPEASTTLPAAPKIKKSGSEDRPKAIIPIPEDAVDSLQKRVKGDWAMANRGTAIKTWAWRMADGRMWCATTRYERDGKKDVIPHYFAENGKWHEGDPLESGRHLYRLDQIVKADAGTHILIVEGEKCASVKVTGYLVTTWIGGGKAWNKTDWAPLERFASAGLVTIWPDADAQLDKQGKLLPWPEQPGQKTSLGIMRRLPGSKIMDVSTKAAVKNGWDIADADAEGIDIVAFIRESKTEGGPPQKTEPGKRVDDDSPFLCLGYDKGGYYFMRKDRRVVYTITMGSFNSSKLGEIAPLSWWGIMGMTTDQGSIRTATAQDMLVTMQDSIGFFDPLRMRGAGVWRDQDGIVLNTGDRIVTHDGRSMTYSDFPSSFYYTPSQTKFGEMFGPESTAEEGKQLEQLFLAQDFMENSMAILTMGWALISCFAGVLTWRPHIWVTGRKGSGKSWVWTHLLQALSGPFAFIANGKTTVAGAMRALDQDVRPAYFGEMEPKSKPAREKISALLELARNASDDSAADTTMSDSGGGVRTFKTRSPMAFMSTMIPMEDGATESRITRVELKPHDSEGQARKRARSDALIMLMDDPGRFRRRIFRALPRIISDIEWVRSSFLGIFGSQRAADQMAPMLAAAWAVQSDLSIRTAQVWLERWLIELCDDSKMIIDDEDTFMSHLISIGLRTDDNTTRSISELLEKVADNKDDNGTALNVLERHGITLRRKNLYSKWILSIATNAEPLAKIFCDTKWGDGYASQIRRNICRIQGETRSIRLKIGNLRCHDLDWEMFHKKYMGEGDEPLLDGGVF